MLLKRTGEGAVGEKMLDHQRLTCFDRRFWIAAGVTVLSTLTVTSLMYSTHSATCAVQSTRVLLLAILTGLLISGRVNPKSWWGAFVVAAHLLPIVDPSGYLFHYRWINDIYRQLRHFGGRNLDHERYFRVIFRSYVAIYTPALFATVIFTIKRFGCRPTRTDTQR